VREAVGPLTLENCRHRRELAVPCVQYSPKPPHVGAYKKTVFFKQALRLFVPDYRNAYHQRFCSEPASQHASKLHSQNNANPRHIQDLLRYQSLATTEHYLRLTITDLKEAHAKCHPREQEKQL
jgi:hypothetical protein